MTQSKLAPQDGFQTIKSIIGPKARLIAVSKLQTVDSIRVLYSQGQRVFAENYVQEALPKQEALVDLEIEWHFIGHLQRNKAKLVVGKFQLIHSVDRWELAEELNKQAKTQNLIQEILLEINLSGETSKSGFLKPVAELFTREVKLFFANHPHLRLRGLMTMPPLEEDSEKCRPYFASLRHLRDELKKVIPSCTELSMGTSSDFKIALEEGANMVRLGTVLFGPRPTDRRSSL